jgi:hypothetical protein
MMMMMMMMMMMTTTTTTMTIEPDDDDDDDDGNGMTKARTRGWTLMSPSERERIPARGSVTAEPG